MAIIIDNEMEMERLRSQARKHPMISNLASAFMNISSDGEFTNLEVT